MSANNGDAATGSAEHGGDVLPAAAMHNRKIRVSRRGRRKVLLQLEEHVDAAAAGVNAKGARQPLGGGRSAAAAAASGAATTAAPAGGKEPLTGKAKARARYKEILARRAAAEQKRKQQDKYRDRAKERRTDANPDYADDVKYANVSGDARQYLGGDVKHTHLVKGLDRALLAQELGAVEQIAKGGDAEREDATFKRDAEGQLSDMFAVAAAETSAKKHNVDIWSMPSTVSSHMGRTLYTVVLAQARNVPTMSVARSTAGGSECVPASSVADMFIPGRMRYECVLVPQSMDENAGVPPKTTVVSTDQVLPKQRLKYDQALLNTLPPTVLAKVTNVMQSLAVEGRSAGKTSKRVKHEKKKKKNKKRSYASARVSSGAEIARTAPMPVPSATPTVDDDDDIFGDAGCDYVGSIGGASILSPVVAENVVNSTVPVDIGTESRLTAAARLIQSGKSKSNSLGRAAEGGPRDAALLAKNARETKRRTKQLGGFASVLQTSDEDPYGLDQDRVAYDDDEDLRYDDTGDMDEEAITERKRREEARFDQEFKHIEQIVKDKREREGKGSRSSGGSNKRVRPEEGQASSSSRSAKRSRVLRGFMTR